MVVMTMESCRLHPGKAPLLPWRRQEGLHRRGILKLRLAIGTNRRQGLQETNGTNRRRTGHNQPQVALQFWSRKRERRMSGGEAGPVGRDMRVMPRSLEFCPEEPS